MGYRGKQSYYKRKIIDTNNYIITFETLKIVERIKINYNMKEIEKYRRNPYRRYKCQKYDHYENIC